MEYLDYVKSRLSEKRAIHSVSVMETAEILAKKYGADADRAKIAGLLHDVTKECSGQEQLALCEKYGIEIKEEYFAMPKILHGFTAAETVRAELGIYDDEILDAIRYHTTGRANMCTLEKIIYLADAIEPTRNYSSVDVIRQAEEEKGLDAAVRASLDNTISDLLSRGLAFCTLSTEARNYLILNSETTADLKPSKV